MNYSILMSVYIKEKPEYLKESIESMLNQTIKSNDFVIVCDGPLSDELYDVLDNFEKDKSNCIHRIQLEKNMGLGKALNIGLLECKNELVARMDSDDISVNNRIARQIEQFINNENLVICGSNISEFSNVTGEIIAERCVPENYADIVSFSKKRNPFNHPSIMFKKKYVEEVGSYLEDFNLFEDYYLWVRLLEKKHYAINVSENLVKMRTSQKLYARRGGIEYAKNMIKFRKWLLDIRWISFYQFVLSAIPHTIVCIIPNGIRKYIYKILRKV